MKINRYKVVIKNVTMYGYCIKVENKMIEISLSGFTLCVRWGHQTLE